MEPALIHERLFKMNAINGLGGGEEGEESLDMGRPQWISHRHTIFKTTPCIFRALAV